MLGSYYIMIPIFYIMRVDYTLYTFPRSTLHVLLSIYIYLLFYVRYYLRMYSSSHLYLTLYYVYFNKINRNL